MSIYRFRVLLQHENEDIFRDIDIEVSDTFQELHNSIQEAFEFDNSQMASFYLSNDDWEKGEELTLFDMNEPGNEDIRMMNEAVLGKTFSGEGDKVLYVFDFMNIWTFHVELVQELKASKNVSYPAVVNFVGTAPNQYSKAAAMQNEEKSLLEGLREADKQSDDLPFQDDIFEDFDDFSQ